MKSQALNLLNSTNQLEDTQSNFTSADSNSISNHVNTFYIISKWLNVIFITLITALGIYGNVMSLRLFLRKFLNKKTQQKLTIYFLLLSFSDLLVLVFHYVDFTFRQWINLLNAHSSEFNFVDKCVLCCKFLPYLRNVFRTVSVYTLLILTVQRFIVLYFPLVRSRFLSLRFNEWLIMGMCLFALCLNMGNLFMNDLVKHKHTGEPYCSVEDQFAHVQFVIDLVFVSMTIIFPTVFIVVFSVIMFMEIRRNLPEQNKQLLNKRNHQNHRFNIDDTNAIESTPALKRITSAEVFSLDTSTEANKKEMANQNNNADIRPSSLRLTSPGSCGNTSTKMSTSQSIVSKYKSKLNHTIRTTYMLVLLSKWFVILHVPYFICWMIFHIYVNKNNTAAAAAAAAAAGNTADRATATSLLRHSLSSSAEPNTLSHSSIPLLFFSKHRLVSKSNLTYVNLPTTTLSTTVTQSLTTSFFNSSLVDESLSDDYQQLDMDSLDPNKVLTLRALVNIFEILFLSNYTVHFFLYLYNIPSFKRAHANELRRILRRILFCFKRN